MYYADEKVLDKMAVAARQLDTNLQNVLDALADAIDFNTTPDMYDEDVEACKFHGHEAFTDMQKCLKKADATLAKLIALRAELADLIK